MPPYASTRTLTTTIEPEKVQEIVQPQPYQSYFGVYKTPLIWLHINSILLFHAVTIFTAFYLPFDYKWQSVLWGFWMGGTAGFGVTAGAHRYWCHRSYKARLPLKLILMACYAMAGQNKLYDWVRDHRVHHKFSETDADPHNSNRGFFFAHMGWLFMKKHPEVIKRGRQIDMSDITDDPLLQFYHKYFLGFKLIFCFLLPTLVPIYCWDEDWTYAFISQCLVRYMLSLHFTWFVNSAAHLFGYKPYDVHINPRENFWVSVVAMGEGWHNYHHTFPWDYKAAELYKLNVTLWWLNFFGAIGWAYDMKSPSDELVRAVMEKRGEFRERGEHDAVPETAEFNKTS